MNLKSFGCSFIFGTDLPDDNGDSPYHSRLTWPALIAKELNFNYQCYARPGSGNLQILERILTQCGNGHANDIFVIGWTWIDRFDYLNPTSESWQNKIIPPKTPWSTIMPVDVDGLARAYYKELHSQYQDKLTTLIYMKTAIDALRNNGIKFIMTLIDELTFEPEWEPNPAINDLQTYIAPYITRFEGKTFLEWSKSRGFEISPTLHPLEAAHKSATEYLIKVFDTKNTNDSTRPVLS